MHRWLPPAGALARSRVPRSPLPPPRLPPPAANAMGPFSAVYYIWENAKVPGKKVAVPTWILAFGGAGIVTGLATYGWHIMGAWGTRQAWAGAARRAPGCARQRRQGGWGL